MRYLFSLIGAVIGAIMWLVIFVSITGSPIISVIRGDTGVHHSFVEDPIGVWLMGVLLAVLISCVPLLMNYKSISPADKKLVGKCLLGAAAVFLLWLLADIVAYLLHADVPFLSGFSAGFFISLLIGLLLIGVVMIPRFHSTKKARP